MAITLGRNAARRAAGRDDADAQMSDSQRHHPRLQSKPLTHQPSFSSFLPRRSWHFLCFFLVVMMIALCGSNDTTDFFKVATRAEGTTQEDNDPGTTTAEIHIDPGVVEKEKNPGTTPPEEKNFGITLKTVAEGTARDPPLLAACRAVEITFPEGTKMNGTHIKDTPIYDKCERKVCQYTFQLHPVDYPTMTKKQTLQDDEEQTSQNGTVQTFTYKNAKNFVSDIPSGYLGGSFTAVCTHMEGGTETAIWSGADVEIHLPSTEKNRQRPRFRASGNPQ